MRGDRRAGEATSQKTGLQVHLRQIAKDLPELRVGETVRMKPLPGDRTGLWRLGSCVQKVAPRSYLVEVNGSLYHRKRVDLQIAEPAPTQNPDGHRGHMTKNGPPASHGPDSLGEEPRDYRAAAPSPIRTPMFISTSLR